MAQSPQDHKTFIKQTAWALTLAELSCIDKGGEEN